MSLVLSALEAIPEVAGTKETGFAWTLYTGDLVSHDPENESSRYVYRSSIFWGGWMFVDHKLGNWWNIPRRLFLIYSRGSLVLDRFMLRWATTTATTSKQRLS